MLGGYWKRRALAAEAKLAEAAETIKGIELRLQDRAALISMVKDGRGRRLLFTRKGELTPLHVYGTIATDWDGMERKLLR